MGIEMWSEANRTNPGIRLGRVARIEVWVHWLFPAILALLLLSDLVRPGGIARGTLVLAWAVSAAALFFSLLVHELAHCHAALRLGGSADRVLLWPLGGLAFCEAPQEPRSQFALGAAGALANALLLGASAAGCAACGLELLPRLEAEKAFRLDAHFLQCLVLWNAFSLLCLLPCAPQDGSRMLLAYLWRLWGSLERARAAARKVGHGVAAIALVASLLLLFTAFASRDFAFRHPFLAAARWGLIIVVAMHALEVRKAAAHGVPPEEESGPFGYDFSRGYASLETTVRRVPAKASLWRSLRAKLRRRAEARRREEEARLEEEVDRLLEKIHRSGMGSLTRAEHRFLLRASRRFRK